MRRPGRIFFVNFLAGIARGLGFAIGFTLLAAIIWLILKKAVAAPVIGRFVSQVLDVIEKQHLLPGP
jgi:inner membrane protein involved in colicin E2 resistance